MIEIPARPQREIMLEVQKAAGHHAVAATAASRKGSAAE
jgi:hypothetical protein